MGAAVSAWLAEEQLYLCLCTLLCEPQIPRSVTYSLRKWSVARYPQCVQARGMMIGLLEVLC